MVISEPFAIIPKRASGFLNFASPQGQELGLQLRCCCHGREKKVRGKYITEMRDTLGHRATCCCLLGPPPALAKAVPLSIPQQQQEAGWRVPRYSSEQRAGLWPSSSPWQPGARGAACRTQSQCRGPPPADKWHCVIIWHPSMSSRATASLSLAA